MNILQNLGDYSQFFLKKGGGGALQIKVAIDQENSFDFGLHVNKVVTLFGCTQFFKFAYLLLYPMEIKRHKCAMV